MARLLNQIIGHEPISKAMLAAFEQNRLGATHLFVGPAGVGKKTLALALAQAMICTKSKQACGECGACLRVESEQSESLLVVCAEKTQIKAEQARGVLRFLSLQSLGTHRVVIIDEAEKLNIQAANALLKILEEPPKNTFFFLIAPSVRSVLPTIRSRAQVWRFSPLTVSELAQKGPAESWCLKAARGSFKRLEMFDDQEIKAWRDFAGRTLSLLPQESHLFLRSEWQETIKKNKAGQFVAQTWAQLLRDAIYYSSHSQDLLNPDQESLVAEISQWPKAALMDIAERSLGLEPSLLQHRDAQLVFTEFWLHSHRQFQV